MFIHKLQSAVFEVTQKNGDVIPRIAYGQNMLTQFAMEISDGRESLSSEINTDGSFHSGDSDISKDDFLFGYVGEPEYKQEELKSMEFSDDDKSNSDEEEND